MIPSTTGSTALVTGGGSGIGRAVAVLLASRGARVAVLDLDETGAAQTVDRIVRDGGDAVAVACDLADPARIDAALTAVSAWGGPVRAACLNAGIGSLGTVETLLLDEWRRTLAVNLEANLHLLRGLLAPMREAGGGSIVAVSSLSAVRADHPESSPAYGISKAALERLVLDVARRSADDGIRANAVRPGPVDTGFVANRLPGPDPGPRAVVGARRADPRDVAAVIAFLLSDEARLITGQIITADAGFSLTGR